MATTESITRSKGTMTNHDNSGVVGIGEGVGLWLGVEFGAVVGLVVGVVV